MYAPYPPQAGGSLGSVGVGATLKEKRDRLKAKQRSQGGRLSPEDTRELARLRAKIAKDDGNVLDDVVDAAGDVVSTVTKGATQVVETAVNTGANIVSTTVNTVTSAVGDVPVLGDVAKIAGDIAQGPTRLASAIASGARIDRALEGELKRQLKNVKDAAPYAQMVLTMVPGVGTGVAAAAAAGIALAEGRAIDDIAKAAIRGAVPGGAAGVAVFDGAMKIASGGNVVKSTLESARAAVPKDLLPVFDTAVAVATGENIQNALAGGLANMGAAQMQELLKIGGQAIASSPALKGVIAGAKSAAEQTGIKTAAGLLAQSGINEKALRAVRDKLDDATRAGFDAALRSQQGSVPWLANVAHQPPRLAAIPAPPPAKGPPRLAAVAPKADPIKLAQPRQTVAKHATELLKTATGPAAGPIRAAASAAGGVPYAPYPQAGVGVGAFFGSDKWRWFGVYNGGRLLTSRGPIRLSDHDALREEAGFLESTQGRAGIIADVVRWDWDDDARQWRRARGPGALGLAGCGGPACRSFGPPLADMDHSMHRAGLSAVNSNGGRPRMVTAPGGTDYQFALEGGRLVARECLR